MIDEIVLENAGEHMGLIFPTPKGIVYRIRVEVDMPEFLSVRGVYVPLGSCRVAPLYDYHLKPSQQEKLPPMPEHVSEFDEAAATLVTAWLYALDLDGILRPAKLPDYDEFLDDRTEHRFAHRPYTQQWVPVTVRDSDDPAWEENCAFPGWTNVLCQFKGMTGVLVHDTW